MISIRGTLLAGYVLLRFGSEKANPSALTLERISPLCHLCSHLSSRSWGHPYPHPLEVAA